MIFDVFLLLKITLRISKRNQYDGTSLEEKHILVQTDLLSLKIHKDRATVKNINVIFAKHMLLIDNCRYEYECVMHMRDFLLTSNIPYPTQLC